MNVEFNVTVCFIAVILSLSWESSVSSTSFSGHHATGTVLFHNKKCWQHEDLALLSSRKIVQNLIPSNELDVSNDRYIITLIDYFHMCFSTIEKMSSGRSQDILLLVLADAIGGYLRYYVIPVTKASYYHGNIRYDHARKLFQFYEEIKVHLDTSGKRWTPPMNTCKMQFKTRALAVNPPCQDEDPCAKLLINDRHCGGSRECSPSERPSPLPMPYLDDARTPTSIAVPFRASSLLPLNAPHAAFVLEKYFVAGSQCLASRGDASREDLAAFNVHLFRWLQKSIVPRLKDEQWYAAFGGVHRILKTIQASGYVNASLAAEGPSSPADERGVDKDVRDDVESSEGNQDSIVTWSLLVAIGFGTLAAWIGMALLCACIRCNGRREKSRPPRNDQNKLVNTFVQIFGDLKGCVKRNGQNVSAGSSGPDRQKRSGPSRLLSKPVDDSRRSRARQTSNSDGDWNTEDEDQDDESDDERAPLIAKSDSPNRPEIIFGTHRDSIDALRLPSAQLQPQRGGSCSTRRKKMEKTKENRGNELAREDSLNSEVSPNSKQSTRAMADNKLESTDTEDSEIVLFASTNKNPRRGD